MKKVLSLIAALSLTLSMSVTVFADETGPAIGDLPNGQDISITAQYEKGADKIPTVYHVTVSWNQTGTLVYNEDGDNLSWNPNDLTYTRTPVSTGSWEVGTDTNAPKVNITVTNRSNAAVNASIDQVKAQGTLAVTGSGSEPVTVASAAQEDLNATGTEQKGYLTYTITNVEGAITSADTQIATLTVKIEAAN